MKTLFASLALFATLVCGQTQFPPGGGNSSSGTVTGVSGSGPAWLTWTIGTPTTTPAISLAPTTGQISHRVIGTCNAATIFGPCALVIGDLPSTVVQGPGIPVVSGHVATFNGTGGATVQDGGVLPTVTGGTCTNQAVTAISGSAVPTCAPITSAYVNSSIVTAAAAAAFNGGFTFAGTLTGNTTVTFPLSGTLAILGANAFTGAQSAPSFSTNGSGAGTFTFTGSSSGSAAIGVGAAAGTPSKLLLPTTDPGAANYVLESGTPSGGSMQADWTNTLTGVNTTGNASTATALASTPTLCSAGSAPRGVLASGNSTGCAVVTPPTNDTVFGVYGPGPFQGATGATNTMYISSIQVPQALTLTGITTYTAGTSSGNLIVMLYNSAGTLVASSASTAQSGSTGNAQQIAFSSTYAAAAGRYFIGVIASSATSTSQYVSSLAYSKVQFPGSFAAPGTITPPTTTGAQVWQMATY